MITDEEYIAAVPQGKWVVTLNPDDVWVERNGEDMAFVCIRLHGDIIKRIPVTADDVIALRPC
jgi:hypothetical protein